MKLAALQMQGWTYSQMLERNEVESFCGGIQLSSEGKRKTSQ